MKNKKDDYGVELVAASINKDIITIKRMPYKKNGYVKLGKGFKIIENEAI